MNALALYGADLQNVRYFVGRENPTSDTTTAVEVGHWNGTTPVLNPTYAYPADYSPAALSPDYSLALYDPGLEIPYFHANGSGTLEPGIDFAFGERVPSLLGKRCYAAAMALALRDNGSLTDATWPSDLCTPEEAAELWAFRATPARYPLLAARSADLAAMLVFAKRDHVQPAPDGPPHPPSVRRLLCRRSVGAAQPRSLLRGVGRRHVHRVSGQPREQRAKRLARSDRLGLP